MICRHALSAVRAQLAMEYGCTAADFDCEKVAITPVREVEGRRYYGPNPPYFRMATFGRNAVITADAALHPWLTDWVNQTQGPWLFEGPRLARLTEQVNIVGQQLWLSHMFLPAESPPAVEIMPTGVTLQWLEGREALEPYYNGRWPNALCRKYEPRRPDMLALAAVVAEEVVALAGCSADTADLWQIGIDVAPAWQGRGIGRLLVGRLRQAIEVRGKVPFYGTSSANLGSWGVALGCGFRPAWVEAYTYEEA